MLVMMFMINVVCCFYGVVLISWLVLRFCRLLLVMVVMVNIIVVMNSENVISVLLVFGVRCGCMKVISSSEE